MHDSRSRGALTQDRILQRAMQIASVQGLEAMSLATLAKASLMSKSGLFAHFQSKEALQLAIIDQAERVFTQHVLSTSQGLSGLSRFRTIAQNYVRYATSGVFEGGCFLMAALHEFDGRPGLVRDRLQLWWHRVNTSVASALHEVPGLSEASVESRCFVAMALMMNINVTGQMMGAARVEHIAGRLIDELVGSIEDETMASLQRQARS
jgi:AcrR family transcriptional regulator